MHVHVHACTHVSVHLPMCPWACACAHVHVCMCIPVCMHTVTCLLARVLQCNTVSDQQRWPGSCGERFAGLLSAGETEAGAGLALPWEGPSALLLPGALCRSGSCLGVSEARGLGVCGLCAVGWGGGGTGALLGWSAAEPGVLGSQALEMPRPHRKTQTRAPEPPAGSLRNPGRLLMPAPSATRSLRRARAPAQH